jgi:hypothetical protein
MLGWGMGGFRIRRREAASSLRRKARTHLPGQPRATRRAFNYWFDGVAGNRSLRRQIVRDPDREDRVRA